MVILSETQKAYMAGIVDGEGCVTLSKSSCRHWVGYRPVITIETTSKELQDWLISVFGQGHVARNAHTGNHKDRYLWCLSGQEDIANVLLQIQPYIVIKKKQVSMMLSVLNWCKKNKSHSYVQDNIHVFRAFRERFRVLNYRGRIANSANSENPKIAQAIMATPSQAPEEVGACVETNVQRPKGVI
jgi:hypothetical protein